MMLHIGTYGVTREQLAMCSVVMSRQAQRHPYALSKKSHTLKQVLESPMIHSVTNGLECARRADGGAAIIVGTMLHTKTFQQLTVFACMQ